MIVHRPRSKLDNIHLTGTKSGFKRVESMNILGVTLTGKFDFDKHIDNIKFCRRARQSLYALRVLAAHGLSGSSLHDVVRATTLTRMLYASPAWWGFVGQDGRTRIQALLRRLVRLRYLPENNPSLEQLCQSAHTRLFGAICADPGHVLHDLLPPIKTAVYALRPRKHDRILPVADSLARKTFIIRMIYS